MQKIYERIICFIINVPKDTLQDFLCNIIIIKNVSHFE